MSDQSRERASASNRPPLDAGTLRNDFPILTREPRERSLVYLDNASTTQKPTAVLDRLNAFYRHENANVHRGVHILSERATAAFEAAREAVRRFIRADDSREIVFTRGTTEAINLVAASYGTSHVHPGDRIVVSVMEHHSNIVPWQMLCDRTGAHLVVLPMSDDGDLDIDILDDLLDERTRLVAVAHVSNVLGTVNRVRDVIDIAHRRHIPVLVDGAQAIAHMPVDVRALNADFYAFSGHKMYGPTGIGVLYGRLALLEAMPPYQGGGDMITSVSFDGTKYRQPPYRFEAGTPSIADAVGFGAAIDYLEALGMERIARLEDEVLTYAVSVLQTVKGLRLVGSPRRRAGAISFVLDNVHPHDAGSLLDEDGVAVRSGHHCCQPLMARLGLHATVRASFGLYNTRDDVERLAASLQRVVDLFR